MNKIFTIILFSILMIGCNKAVLVPLVTTEDVDSPIVGTWQWEYTERYDNPDDPEDVVREDAGEDELIWEVFEKNGDYSMMVYTKLGSSMELDFEMEGKYSVSDDVLRITMYGMWIEHRIIEVNENRYIYEESGEDGSRAIHYYFKVSE